MKKLDLLVLSLLLGFVGLGFAGCGPSETSAERDQNQIQANYQDRLRTLQPLAGHYHGIFSPAQASPYDVDLDLTVLNTQQTSPGVGGTLPVATLGGKLSQCVGMDQSNGTTCDAYSVFSTFSAATYDRATHALSANGTFTLQPGSTDPAIANFLLNVNGNQMTGTVSTGGTVVGTLDLTKAQ